MKFGLNIKIMPDENWWGGVVDDAYLMPLTKLSRYRLDLTNNWTYNQGSPLFLSDKGRYFYCESGFKVNFCGGLIEISADRKIIFYEGGTTLRSAYLHASKNYFPPDGTYPNETMFRVPQYCTWIDLLSEQTEDNILNFAKSILHCNMPAGEIIIDNGWQTNYGDWTFNAAKFKDPKGMIDKLHDLGFKVIMWIVPYVSPDSKAFLGREMQGGFIRRRDGEVYLAHWWEGWSAVLDFSNQGDLDWFYQQTDRLMREFGVDGFKQDGGDARFVYGDYVCSEGDANRQSELYALSALRFGYNELRACFKAGGKGIAQRIADRHHSWDEVEGLRSLVPNSCLQGLLGYPFSCPDMAGGGLSGDFIGKSPCQLDQELFIRSVQASALMPMIQLSYAFWLTFNGNTADICLKHALLHAQMHDYIMQCVISAAKTGEPIIRNMAYQFNKFAYCNDQFMLGEQYLVAPVLVKGATSRTVKFAEGKWQCMNTNKIYEVGEYEIQCGLDFLPWFKRLE